MSVAPLKRPSLRARHAFERPDSLRARMLGTVIDHVSGLNRLDEIYQGIDERIDTDRFLAETLASLGFDYRVTAGTIDRIPRSGPAIVIANHPFGVVDGVAVAHLLRSIRPDCKLLVNEMLGRFVELDEIFIKVNVFGDAAKNSAPLREALGWLREGGLLFVFPSGEVSSVSLAERRVVDPPWSDAVARFIRRAKVPVVPIFIAGQNSPAFQLFGMIHPRVRTLLLPRELVNKRGVTAELHIGKPITPEQLAPFEDATKLANYLRARVYLLSVLGGGRSLLKWIPNVRRWFERTVNDATVAPAESVPALKAEIESLPPTSLLVSSGNYHTYVAMADEIPTVMREIGRLREVTFRGVGEGSGNDRDLDVYDTYYHQLFIWDSAEHLIVGGYRIGVVEEIVRRYGPRGLYTSTLFRLSPQLMRELSQAVELGRSFVRPEYQRSYASLMMLWRGIGAFVARSPQHSLLFGPVSISNDYQPASQQLLVRFLRAQKYEVQRARHVRARHPFRIQRRKLLGDLGIEEADLQWISEFVGQLEDDSKGVPILLRQYLKMGGQILGFNIDNKFSDVLDCLLMVDLTQTDPQLLTRYLGEQGAESFLKYHLERGRLSHVG